MVTKERGRRPGTPAANRPGKTSGRTPAKRNRRPSVVYTDPRPFSGRRFALRLLTVVAVTLAVLLGISVFFKVDESRITVSGGEKYSPREVIEASGLRGGENLLTLSDAQITGRIIAKLPYVNKARVGIKLPDTVMLEIEELDVMYSIQAQDGSWWLMSAQGKILDGISAGAANGYTRVMGVKLQEPVVGNMAVAFDPEPETLPPETAEPNQETEESETEQSAAVPEQLPMTVRAADQLKTAVAILTELEKSGIAGEAASVDVTEPVRLEVWYGKRYQVNLGDSQRLAYKIRFMKQAIDQMGDHQGGQLDVSFTNLPDKAVYTPFSE